MEQHILYSLVLPFRELGSFNNLTDIILKISVHIFAIYRMFKCKLYKYKPVFPTFALSSLDQYYML
jgi:hypothetical protein